MELVMLGSNAFAHIVEALILWMGMSQMYEARYKQVVTGLVIMVGHAIMFWVFLTGNIYVVTIVNNLIYILLIALLYNVSKRSAIFWAVIYNAMMAISELIMFFTARYIVGIENAGRKDTVDIIFMFCLCNISYFLITQTMVFIKKKSIAFDKNDMSKILLMGSLTTSLIVFNVFCHSFYGACFAFINNIINSFYDLLYYWNNMESASERNHLDDDKFSWIGVF